jgi:U3 small nucleolar RNA-associated protein 14
MPGRQSTVPAALHKPKSSKKRTQKRSLNALAIAEQQNPRKTKIRQNRLGETEYDGTKRRRDSSDGDEDDELSSRAKRLKPGEKDQFGNEIEGGSDSEGNEWVTGKVASDDDSDIDSDEAFDESDGDRFEGFVFRGSSTAKTGKNLKGLVSKNGSSTIPDSIMDLGEPASESDADDTESDGFAEEAVDLATMLDVNDEESDAVHESSEREEENAFGGAEDGVEDESSSDEQDSTLSVSDVDEGTNNEAKLSTLNSFISSLENTDVSSRSKRNYIRDAQEAATPSDYGINPKKKLTVADLLPTITDPRLRKSLKLLSEDPKKASKKTSGIPQKLDVPLAKRQQNRLDRAAAYERSKEVLSRWIDTVKHNRRAEHLSFPLANPDALAAKDTKRSLATTQAKPLTSLESTIHSILVDSGLAPSGNQSPEGKIQEFEELALKKIPIEEVQARRAELRKARELLFREEVRAKRIKKIKSKSYRRVHRKERERNLLRQQELNLDAGGEPSENEQERNDRRRAEERMGARHRESKWGKSIKETGRAAWDEDARNGVTEMARRDEELRRRIAGKAIGTEDDNPLKSSSSSDEGDNSSSDDDPEDDKYIQKLSQKLGAIKNLSDKDLDASVEAKSRLLSMKFMQRAEAARKEQNNADIEKMRRDLAGEDSPSESDTSETHGRRSYGPDSTKQSNVSQLPAEGRNEFEEGHNSDDEAEPNMQDKELNIMVHPTTNSSQSQKVEKPSRTLRTKSLSKDSANKQPAEPGENPWLKIASKRSSKRDRLVEVSDDILIDTNPPAAFPTAGIPGSPELAFLAKYPKSILSAGAHFNEPPKDVEATAKPDDDADSFAGFSSRASSPEPDTRGPTFLTNQDLINAAFAGDDVLADFKAEKTATALLEGPQTVSTDLPGWGSWTGEGISKRELKRNVQTAKRNVTIIPGIDPSKRKDAKLDRVVVNEKRVKKNAMYLASQLPHPFETRAQYERALRIPVGPEWTTKEVFQQATMPRIMIKQGVIPAMERPMI